MSGAHLVDGGRMARALRASGLPALWAARYPALADPLAGARAAAHVSGSLGRLPVLYRVGAEVALRAAGLVTRPVPAAKCDRLARVPGFGRLLAVTDSLALYGGLDGEPSK
ncbi:hypothetical protein CP973_38765 [Streptomyces albofaciens JCM 4342]|uniref:hypothetical protein n=1 Tax=Streptomyces albofaciens TaxID=66866 RepID=UPI00123AED8F|nr:hypothetical protein [Streptomyces albofaciens]KAA6214955.1 hypothetical protein CP973_38765 [Streptomyces albofaciens JCM 4342]